MGNLINDIERYGHAVDAGEMTVQAAASALLEAHQGLTLVGATDLLAAHADYTAQRHGFPAPDHLVFVKENGRPSLVTITNRELLGDVTPAFQL